MKRQDKLKEKVKTEKPPEIHVMYESAISSDTDVSDIYMTLEQSLTEQDMELLREYCLEGKEIEDISVRTGLSSNHIRVRIHRIRKLLRTILNSMIKMLS